MNSDRHAKGKRPQFDAPLSQGAQLFSVAGPATGLVYEGHGNRGSTVADLAGSGGSQSLWITEIGFTPSKSGASGSNSIMAMLTANSPESQRAAQTPTSPTSGSTVPSRVSGQARSRPRESLGAQLLSVASSAAGLVYEGHGNRGSTVADLAGSGGSQSLWITEIGITPSKSGASGANSTMAKLAVNSSASQRAAQGPACPACGTTITSREPGQARPRQREPRAFIEHDILNPVEPTDKELQPQTNNSRTVQLQTQGLSRLAKRKLKGYRMCGHMCPARFTSIWKLAEHLDTEHEKLYRPYKCKVLLCPWSVIGFHEESHCQRHSRTVHSERRYICSVESCRKMFARKDSYRRHMHILHP